MKSEFCEPFQELASAFTDGVLAPPELTALQEHLRVCDDCRRFLSDISRVRDLLRAEEGRRPLETAGPGFAAAVAGKVAGERVFVPSRRTARPLGRGLWTRFSGAAAAAVLLVTVGWSWHRLSAPPSPPPVAGSPRGPSAADEGSVAAYLREHALETMDATLLGSPEGLEMASFEVLRRDFE